MVSKRYEDLGYTSGLVLTSKKIKNKIILNILNGLGTSKVESTRPWAEGGAPVPGRGA